MGVRTLSIGRPDAVGRRPDDVKERPDSVKMVPDDVNGCFQGDAGRKGGRNGPLGWLRLLLQSFDCVRRKTTLFPLRWAGIFPTVFVLFSLRGKDFAQRKGGKEVAILDWQSGLAIADCGSFTQS
jgi:hypothetical protein